jgi:membrane protein implicated in regulation of membrane protease activity
MMQWWAWIAVGAILLGAELTFVNAQFYLVFVGASALIVGFLGLAELNVPAWLQWLLFILLAVGSLLGFRRRFYERLRPKLPVMKATPAGELVVLPQALPPGEACRLEYRGSSWSALNAGRSVIAAGARARIERVDGLTLIVHADN